MNSSSALTPVDAAIRCVRWAVVLALVSSLLGELACSALDPQGSAHPPAMLAVVQYLVHLLVFYALKEMAFVVVGALIAPRARFATAIVLASLLVLLSLQNHVLSQPHPGATNYTHVTLEAAGSVLGVVYIFWSQKAKGSLPSGAPSEQPAGSHRECVARLWLARRIDTGMSAAVAAVAAPTMPQAAVEKTPHRKPFLQTAF